MADPLFVFAFSLAGATITEALITGVAPTVHSVLSWGGPLGSATGRVLGSNLLVQELGALYLYAIGDWIQLTADEANIFVGGSTIAGIALVTIAGGREFAPATALVLGAAIGQYVATRYFLDPKSHTTR